MEAFKKMNELKPWEMSQIWKTAKRKSQGEIYEGSQGDRDLQDECGFSEKNEEQKIAK